jgi:hypothetical protein
MNAMLAVEMVVSEWFECPRNLLTWQLVRVRSSIGSLELLKGGFWLLF